MQTFMAILNRYKHFSLYVTCSNDFIPVVLNLFERQLRLSKHVQAQLPRIKMCLLIYKYLLTHHASRTPSNH